MTARRSSRKQIASGANQGFDNHARVPNAHRWGLGWGLVEGDRLDVEEPAHGQMWAVTTARTAFDGEWTARMSDRDRGRMLGVGLIHRKADRLTELEVRDCCKPIAEARNDIAPAASLIESAKGLG